MDKFVYSDYDLGSSPAEYVRKLVKPLRKMKVKSILDYCCGNGRNALFLSREGFDLTCIDHSSIASELKEIAKKNSLPINIGELANGEITLPFPKENFDAVLAWRVLHRGLAIQRKTELEELKRVIKNKGYLILAVSSEEDIEKDAQRRPHKKVEEKTFSYISKGVKNIRYYFTREEIKSGTAFPGFEIISLDKIQEATGHKGQKYLRNYWVVIARKN